MDCCRDGLNHVCYIQSGTTIKMIKVDKDNKQIDQGYKQGSTATDCASVVSAFNSANKGVDGNAYKIENFKCENNGKDCPGP